MNGEKLGIGIFAALSLLLASGPAASAITNAAIAASGTNIVLSWPSQGYETYLIQYRGTLDASDPWSDVTNDFPANSTNRTAYTLYGLIPPPSTNGTGGVMGGPLPDPGDTNSYSGGGTNFGATQSGFYRVFHIPDWLADFDGYTFDGPTFIPVDYESPDAPTNAVEGSTVLVNGQPTDYAALIPEDIGGVTYLGMGVYFDRLPNGTNTIQLLTTVRQSDTLDDQTAYMTFSNAPAEVAVGNLVAFTNWDDLAWTDTNYTFRAQCGVTNVDWEIDIYDVYDDFVNYATGHSDDGGISWTWDLTDYTGASRADGDDDPDFYPYITVTPDSGGSGEVVARPDSPGGTTRAMPPVAAAFPDKGGWVVSYLDNFYTDGTTNYNGQLSYFTNGINSIVAAAALWSLPVVKFPIAYGRVYSQSNRDVSWSNLKSWIFYPQYRNLYYNGHGAPNFIGSDENTVDASNNITGGITLPNSKAYLSAQQVHDNVAFNSNGARPYRFVFLDGCNTANGSFASAFSIPTQATSGSWFMSDANTRHVRPAAFMGWNVTVGGTAAWGTIPGYWQFRTDWASDWSNTFEEDLAGAIVFARDNSGWVPPAQITGHLVTVGDTALEYVQYNYGGDW